MGWRKSELPKGYQDWPSDAIDLDTAKLQTLYRGGFAGAQFNPEARAAMLAKCAEPDGERVAHAHGFASSGEGKLSIPFVYAMKHWPRVWPSPAQTTGSCVSKAGKNAAIVNIGVECELALPDEVTGKVEGWPEISAEAEAQGVIASEPIYGARGHSGQGANCGTLQDWMMSEGGILLRKNYTEIGLDLTTANDNIGARWGGSGTPSNVAAIGKQHQFRTATDCPRHEVSRDFVANGYAIWVCSGFGWSDVRDENGYSVRRGSWSHSWIVDGYDDRDMIKQIYGFPLFHYTHDWGLWNSGGRRIKGTEIDIPEGSFWGDARLLDSCDCTAMSSVNGWPRRELPHLGATGVV